MRWRAQTKFVRRLPTLQLWDRVKRRGRRRRPPQIEGGARAWNEKYGENAHSNASGASVLTTTNVAGIGNTGATEGAAVLANWINAQIGQSKSADPFDLPFGAAEFGKDAPD